MLKSKKIKLPFAVKKPVLALGGQSKNSVCFTRGSFAYLSRIHPDLNNHKDFLLFEQEVKYFLKQNPGIIACDLHPEYQSSKYALEISASGYKMSSVQHHHAHITSCMAENGLKNQKVIGVAFDGTGLGSDNTLWGAEFLICDYKGFKRKGHLKTIPLLGGEKAILEPWRLAAAWLYFTYKERFLSLGIDFITEAVKNKWVVLKKMYLSALNSPSASSMGRLFDAVGSLVLGKHNAGFEAELAIKLEQLASRYRLQVVSYKFKVVKSREAYILDPASMFKQIVSDIKKNSPKEKIAYRFHLTVAKMIVSVCAALRRENFINKVALSGGVFQNKLLLRLALDLLYKQHFVVYVHKELSCADSSISLGQAAIAGFRG